MYQGKRLQKKNRPGIRWRGKNAAVLVSALAILLALSVGGTVAFLVAKDDPVTNVFNPSKVSCEVKETFDGASKTNVAIENTGDTEAYIRAAIVVTWQDASGNVYAGKPEEGADKHYTLSLNQEDWTKGSDGFYYHSEPVDAGKSTEVLIVACSPVEENTQEGYDLNVEILGSAIQSVPTSVVTSVWSSGVSGVNADGTLSIIGQ